MATRLYFHDAASILTGTLPPNEQSTRTAEWVVTGTTTNRTMDTNIGAGQVTRQGNTTAFGGSQDGFLGIFISPPLAVNQTVGGGTMTLNAADSESDTAANFRVNALNVYVWRPSTGVKIGTLRDAAGTLGGAEGGTSETVTHMTGITSTGINALAGDVIVCEVWANHTQDNAVSYTCSFYYDGTTVNTTENASVSNHASFLELAETLTFLEFGNRIRMMI